MCLSGWRKSERVRERAESSVAFYFSLRRLYVPMRVRCCGIFNDSSSFSSSQMIFMNPQWSEWKFWQNVVGTRGSAVSFGIQVVGPEDGHLSLSTCRNALIAWKVLWLKGVSTYINFWCSNQPTNHPRRATRSPTEFWRLWQCARRSSCSVNVCSNFTDWKS